MQRTVKNYAEAPTSPIGSKGPLKNRLKITSVVQYPDGYAFTSSKKPGSLFTFLSVFQPMLSRYTFITSHLFHRLPLHSSLPLIMPYNHGRKHRRSLHVSETTSLLQPVEQEPTVTWRETWSLVRPYVTPNTLRLRLLACFSLLMVFSRKAVTLVRPYGYKLAVDAFANNLVMGTTTVPYIPVIMFVVAGLASNLFNCLRNMSYSVVSSDATKRFGVDMFDHLQCLSLAFHLQRKTGEVTKVMDRGIQSIDSISNTVLFTLLPTYVTCRNFFVMLYVSILHFFSLTFTLCCMSFIFFPSFSMVEACVVTGIFVHLGTPYIALTVFLSVVAYFFFTFTMTTWRYVNTFCFILTMHCIHSDPDFLQHQVST